MYSIPCPHGRLQVAHLASMSLRAVIGLCELTYLARPRPKLTVATTLTGARFQPRDEAGRFVPYADLWCAINIDYAMTAFSYDEIDAFDDYFGEIDGFGEAGDAGEADRSDRAATHNQVDRAAGDERDQDQ